MAVCGPDHGHRTDRAGQGVREVDSRSAPHAQPDVRAAHPVAGRRQGGRAVGGHQVRPPALHAAGRQVGALLRLIPGHQEREGRDGRARQLRDSRQLRQPRPLRRAHEQGAGGDGHRVLGLRRQVAQLHGRAHQVHRQGRQPDADPGQGQPRAPLGRGPCRPARRSDRAGRDEGRPGAALGDPARGLQCRARPPRRQRDGPGHGPGEPDHLRRHRGRRGRPGLSVRHFDTTNWAPEELIRILELKPLPLEGGFYRETWRSSHELPSSALPDGCSGSRAAGTAIYYLLAPQAFSALHRLRGDEIYHFYLGDPVDLLVLAPDGTGREVCLGQDLLAGQTPQFVVPAGCWQGARLAAGGLVALLGTTMAPGFHFSDYEHGQREPLLARYPAFEPQIRYLTR
ncbi:MAG: cupin domain-containing protein [Candidatus Riflebacteria bacterium]|nr:cupin domain-containing protein [Candidatus Riflebacteria bacterium]